MNRSLGDKQERDQLKVITVGIVLLSLYSLVSMVLWSFRWLVHCFGPVIFSHCFGQQTNRNKNMHIKFNRVGKKVLS